MQVVTVADGDRHSAGAGVDLVQLLAGERMNVQYYEFEPGSGVEEHEHPNEQLGFVHEGTLTLIADGEERDVEAGSAFSIPGGVPHSAENRGETTVRGIDVFSPPRDQTPWDE